MSRSAAPAIAAVVVATLSGLLPPPAVAGPAERGPSLMGRTASFKALAYDDPAKPLYDGLNHLATVTDAVEFGLGPEGPQNNLDVVPAVVDISAHRIEIDFRAAQGTGYIVPATFNGYLLAFEPECLVIDGARVDTAFSTIPLTDADMTFEGRTLKINLSGRYYDPSSHIGIELHFDDCPLS